MPKEILKVSKEISVNEVRVAGYIPQDDLRDEAEAFLKFVLSRGKYISENIGINEARLDEESIVANGIAVMAESARNLLVKFWGMPDHKEKWKK